MLEDVLRQLPSLGVSGLLFVMWWFERQERGRGTTVWQGAAEHARQAGELNGRLLSVIQANTEALIALREELRSHRETETDGLNRLSRQLEKLESA